MQQNINVKLDIGKQIDFGKRCSLDEGILFLLSVWKPSYQRRRHLTFMLIADSDSLED